jgi:hypothetical protein
MWPSRRSSFVGICADTVTLSRHYDDERNVPGSTADCTVTEGQPAKWLESGNGSTVPAVMYPPVVTTPPDMTVRSAPTGTSPSALFDLL